MTSVSSLKALAATALLFLSCSAPAQEWKPLFNGKDLNDWYVKIHHHPVGENFGNTFRAEDGMIKVRYDQYGDFNNQYGHLYYKQPYSSYHLKMEYRFTGEWMKSAPSYTILNSGVMYHSQDPRTMPPEQEFGKFLQHWWYTEGAYNMLHSTKPQTLAFALNDSPAGLASWIVEKLFAWTDNGGRLDNSLTKDEVLTNIMIYWVTQTINSSMRTYLESARGVYTTPGGLQSYKRVSVPTGVASFPGEAPIPKEWAERWVNVQRFTKMPKGGHFAALETPEAWVGELNAFFETV